MNNTKIQTAGNSNLGVYVIYLGAYVIFDLCIVWSCSKKKLPDRSFAFTKFRRRQPTLKAIGAFPYVKIK